MPVIYDPTEEEIQLADDFDIQKYDKQIVETLPSRQLCLIHKNLSKYPEKRLYLAGAHTASLMMFLVYASFYIRKHPQKFMDLKKLNFRHVIWRGTKIATGLGAYYLGGLYLLFRNQNLRKKSKIREDIEYELLNRNTI